MLLVLLLIFGNPTEVSSFFYSADPGKSRETVTTGIADIQKSHVSLDAPPASQ